MRNILLQISNITKSFSGVSVLHGVNFDLREGEVLGLVGENGAGKSTLMNIIGGVFPMDSGTMQLAGETYLPKNPLVATGRGIAFIHQDLNLFSNLTVTENLFIEKFPHTAFGGIDRKKMRLAALEYIKRFSLPVEPETVLGSLPAGIQQMVEISKSLMQKARILIFDEPTTSLSKKEKEDLFATIAELKEKGIAIIYISHILEDIFRLCDRITILRDGRIIETRETSEFTEAALIQGMVGREMTGVFPSMEKEVLQSVLLEAKHIKWKDKVKDVSFAIRAGEIVGMYGLMGAGRTELARVLFGVESIDEGEVVMNSHSYSRLNPGLCIGEGAAFITEDRHHEGLLMTKSVDENLGLVKMSRLLNWAGVVDRKAVDTFNQSVIRNLRIKAADFRNQTVNTLSGGNQQKVVFGKWTVNDPKILILDEPTKGVDVGAKLEIYSVILNLAKGGSAVLFISSEIEELMGTCDRILVMKDGRISGEVAKPEFDQKRLLELALKNDN